MTRVSPFGVALADPLETAEGTIDRREGLLVRVGDDPPGLGEASPLPGWTESLEACRAAVDGADWPDGDLPAAADLPAMTDTPAARHGLELALLDREARVAGVPLYRHLGGDRRVTSLPVNATLGDADAAATVEAGEAAVHRGYRTLKVKVGARPHDEDLARLERLRSAVGDGIALRVDANGAWDEADAAAAVDALAALGVDLVEQPVPADDLDGLAALRGRGVDVAADEAVRDHGVGAVLAADAADVVVLKPMVIGGVGRATEAGRRAAEAGADVVVTTTVDAVVARAGAVHLAAALDPDRACGLATADRLASDLGTDPAAVVDGAASVPQSAGHGVGVGDLD